jgi:hypothetical protein
MKMFWQLSFMKSELNPYYLKWIIPSKEKHLVKTLTPEKQGFVAL